MSNININANHFHDHSLVITKSPQPKINIKINKIDLYIIDELAKIFDDTRSQVVNLIIEKIIREFLNNEVENFDTKYLIAERADQINPDLNNSLPAQSWLFEIDTEQSIRDIINRYSEPNNHHSYEHDTLKEFFSTKE